MSNLILKVNEAPWYVKLRVLRALTNQDIDVVADGAGIHSRTLWLWESGKQDTIPRKNNRKAICAYYGVLEEDVFGMIENEIEETA